METEEGNILIAEFMGILWKRVAGQTLVLSDDDGKSWYGKLYDKDWNSLMPVVEKIDKVAPKCFEDNNSPFAEMLLNTPIETVWLAVVEFIKWYNQQKKV